MIIKCVQCSKEIESETGRQKYCADCALQRKREKALAYTRKKRGTIIVRKAKTARKSLLSDVSASIAHNMSYGEYMMKRKEGRL